jgi:hypothetical protein
MIASRSGLLLSPAPAERSANQSGYASPLTFHSAAADVAAYCAAM